MTFAVVTVDMPYSNIGRQEGSWPAFSHDVSQLVLPVGKSRKPSENVWLLDLSNASGVLAGVVHAAQSYQIAHRVLYFSEPPIEYSFPQNP